MRITFLGHACLLIEAANTRIITDPYSSEIGYLPVNEQADLVTLSHENPKWHSFLEDISGDFEQLWMLKHIGATIVKGGVTIESILVHEVLPDDGPNAMTKITAEGIRVLHLGDLGHLPTAEQLAACGEVDVLLALSGGNPTISLDDLMTFIGQLNPKVVIPMHYAVPHLAMKAHAVGQFAELWEQKDVHTYDVSGIDITPELLARGSTQPQLHILQPARARS